MSILVVGSVAYDTIRTPSGEVKDTLGGSATYFAAAAGFFAPVKIIAAVGDDFSKEELAFLEDRGVDLGGLQQIALRIAALRLPMLVVQEGGYRPETLGQSAVTFLSALLPSGGAAP